MKLFYRNFFVILALTLIFSSKVQAFDLDMLKNLLIEEMRKIVPNKEVSISEIKFIGFSPKDNCIPAGVKIREIKRPSSVEFTFYCGNRLYRAVGNYEIMATVFIPQRTLRKGEVVNEEDIIEIKKISTKLPAGAITDKNLLIGKTVRRTIAQGVVIKEDHIYSATPVKRGTHVKVMIISGKVTIMTEGVLKSDATVGDIAKVQCFQTGKEIVGELVEKDSVRVML